MTKIKANTMTLESVKIRETRNLILIGTAIISGVSVEFSYNKKADKFTSVVYDKYRAHGIFDEAHNQPYLVGRLISKAIKNNQCKRLTK